MTKFQLIILFVLLVIAMSACKREYIGDHDSNYIGEWHSDTISTSTGGKEVYIIIDGENSEYGFLCDLNCTSCECAGLTSGKALINHKHNILIIGSGNGEKRYHVKIKTPPYMDNSGQWIFVLDGSGKTVDIPMYKR